MKRALRKWALICLGSALAALPAAAGHGPDWTVLTIQAAYVKHLLEAGQRVILIDLRTVEEYRKSRLPGALSIPLSELRGRFQDIPKTGLVVLYCACPSAEIHAAYLFLRDQSYRNLAVMDGDFSFWVKMGYPVER